MSRTYKDAPYMVRSWRRDPRYRHCPSDWRTKDWPDYSMRKTDYDRYVYEWSLHPHDDFWYDGRKAYHTGRHWNGTRHLKKQEHKMARMNQRTLICHEDYDSLPTHMSPYRGRFIDWWWYY